MPVRCQAEKLKYMLHRVVCVCVCDAVLIQKIMKFMDPELGDEHGARVEPGLTLPLLEASCRGSALAGSGTWTRGCVAAGAREVQEVARGQGRREVQPRRLG